MTDVPQLALLVTAGDGPEECSMAVGHILERMQGEAEALGLDWSAHVTTKRKGSRSATVVVHGAQAARFGQAWIGTVQWRVKSPIRKHHKRSNWFVGVFKLPTAKHNHAHIAEADVAYSTLRAGGPGGQHQNTTDSAVRAVHGPTGLTVVVREARSQHRNKALALRRLQDLSDGHAAAEEDAQKSRQNRLHRGLERGSPIRVFAGLSFNER